MRTTATSLVFLILMAGCDNSPKNQQAANSTQPTTPAMEINSEKTETPSVESTDEAQAQKAMLAAALAQVKSGKALLVDVRRDEEWNEFHFQSAKHIPIAKINEDAKAAFAGIEKEQTVFFH